MNPLNSQPSQTQFFITTGMPPLVPTSTASILNTSTTPVITNIATNPSMNSHQINHLMDANQTTTHLMDANKYVTTTNYVPVLLTNQPLITNVDPMQQHQQQTQNITPAIINVTNSPVVATADMPLMSSNKPVVMTTNPAGNITYQVLTSPQPQSLGPVLAGQNGTVSVLLTAPTTMATSGHVAAPFIIRNTPTAVPNVTATTHIKQPQQQQLYQQQLHNQTFNTQQLNPEILKQIVVGNNTTHMAATLAPGTTLLKTSLLQSRSALQKKTAQQPKILNKSKMLSTQQQQLNSQQISPNCDTSGTMIDALTMELAKTTSLTNTITPPLITQAVHKLPQVSLLQNSQKNKQPLNVTCGLAKTSATISSEKNNETSVVLTNPNEVRMATLNAEVSLIKKTNLNAERSKEMSILKVSQEKQEASLLKPNKHEVSMKTTAAAITDGNAKSEIGSLLKPAIDLKKKKEISLGNIQKYNSKPSEISFNGKRESLLKTKNKNSEPTSRTTSRNQRSKSYNSALKSTQNHSSTINTNERRYSEPAKLEKVMYAKSIELNKINKLGKSGINTMESEDLDTLLEEFEDEEYLESSGDKSDAISKDTLSEVTIHSQEFSSEKDSGNENTGETDPKTPKKNAGTPADNKAFSTSKGISSNKQKKEEELKNQEPLKKIESDSDDDVTILPMDDSCIEPIEIDDDDEDGESQTVPKNASPSIKDKFNESLLCDEQILISSSSSISNQSLDQISSSSSGPKKSPKFESTKAITTAPILKKSLLERKPPVVKEEHSSGYSTVLDMLSNFNMLNWRERIGAARGTNLKFQLNEFNLLQLYEKIPPRTKVHTAYEKPVYERDNLQLRSENGEPLIYYMCRRCKVRAPALDFLAPEFCSLYCLKRDCRKRQREVNACTLRKKQRYVVNNSNPPPLAYITQPKFRWSNYLKANYTSIAAPISLFLNPFPTGPNNFKIGMKLEAIDPENCALFCVCTVVDINGYRLKLSFDGYDTSYDFWLNADSMDIFPPGWCAKTNRILQPPKGISVNKFNWGAYLNREKATSAPRHLFTHLNSSSLIPRNPFQIGMHLEAEDLNDTGKLCVASVADVLDDRIRIHFDGWDDCYDIIVDINSPYIHPCGWHEGRHQLVVPPDCENSAFNWDNYIRKQGKGVIPTDDFFSPREAIHFRPNMKLEVVDPRNSSLIRPATVVSHKGHRVKLHLDGWPTDYCFWLEDDSPDLHPIGWCDATGHDLEPPPGFQMSKQKMPCPTTGCRGIGNAKKSFMNVHATRDCCPYVPENWRIVMEKPPRLSYDEIVRTLPRQTKQNTQQTHQRLSDQQILERLQMLDNIKTRNVLSQQEQITTTPKDLIGLSLANVKKEEPNEASSVFISTSASAAYKSDGDSKLDINLEIAKEFLCDYGPRLQQTYTLWQTNFTFDAGKIKRNPILWSVSEVGVFVDLYLNCRQTAALLAQEDINGEAFLLLQQDDLTERLGMKLGPAVKLYTSILQLRTLAVTKFNVAYRKASIK